MRKIILCFLLMCCIGLWANPAEQDPLKNDSARIDSVRTGSVNKIDTATYLTVNDIDAIANKIVEKMKQENKGKIAIMTKKIAVSTGEIIIGVLVIILGVLVGLLYKLFKKLKEGGRNQEENFRVSEHRLASIEKNVTETAKNVEQIKKKVVEEVKQVVTKPIVKEDNAVGDVDKEESRYETSNKNIIYAKPLRNGNLKATTETSEAIYVISVKKDNTGKFSLYENEDQKKRAIKNKDDMLDLFCNAKGSSIGAKTIKNLNEGEVRLLENDIWEVTQKAEIGFIKE